jgi:UDP-glucose 4-epimerase
MPEIEIHGQSVASVDLTEAEQVASLAGLLNKYTAVIMCAAIKKQLGDNAETFNQNLKIAVNLARLLETHPISRFILFSSAAEYGEDVHNLHIDEETPVQPVSYYGIAKFASERIFYKALTRHEGCTYLIIRPALVYGPAEADTFYSPSGFLKAALRKESIILWGDGEERREFVYIDDLVEATYRLIFHPYSGVVNMVSGLNYQYIDALKIISELIPDHLQIKSRPRSKPNVDHGFNNQRLLDLAPDLVFTSLREGLKQVFEFERNRQRSGEPS